MAATHAGDTPEVAAVTAPDLADAVTAASTTVDPVPATTTSETHTDAVPFAEVEGAELVLPAAEVVAHGFHEAGGGGPTPLTPVGTVVDEGDLNGFDVSTAVADADGPEYLVLPTRNRGTAPTGAVDIVVEEDEPVLAPIDGVVTAVADYRVYGNHHDTLVHVRPTAAPHLEVKVLHIEGVRVAEGDTVVAGETVLAERARRIPVANQIDRFVGRELPHIHLEVLSA